MIKKFFAVDFSTKHAKPSDITTDNNDTQPSEPSKERQLSSNLVPCFDNSIPTEDDFDDWEKNLIRSYQPEPANKGNDDDKITTVLLQQL